MNNYTRALLLFLLTTTGVVAQINFEKGYFIDQNNQKTECYIKNEDWINNPSEFEYKLTPNGKTKTLRSTNLKTLVIDNAFKFEKHIVPYDDSERSTTNLSYERSPKYKETELILNVLVEGKATLYSYRDEDKRAFYVQLDDGNIRPLIYNVYTNKDRNILYNNRYQQQLLTEFPCEGINEKKVTRVAYKSDDLKSFFKDYNECKGSKVVEFYKAKKGEFHLKVFAGAYSSSAVSDLGFLGISFGGVETATAWSPTFGVELTYVLPFNKNKWAVFIAPNYSSYEGEGSFFDLAVQRAFKLEYSAIQIPIGFKHYMFLNDTSKISLSAAVLIDALLNAEGSGNVTIEKDGFQTSAGFALGVGFSYDNYSIEARYLPSRQLLENNASSNIELDQFSITIGYTIF
ncbi:MAG: hypothetical protein AAF617_06705 [Bacteroidota bacterium]